MNISNNLSLNIGYAFYLGEESNTLISQFYKFLNFLRLTI